MPDAQPFLRPGPRRRLGRPRNTHAASRRHLGTEHRVDRRAVRSALQGPVAGGATDPSVDDRNRDGCACGAPGYPPPRRVVRATSGRELDSLSRRRRTGDCPRRTSEDLYARIVPIWVSDVEAWPANSTSVNAATGEHDAKTHRSHAIPPAFHQLTCLMAPETMSVIGPITGGRSPYRVRVRASRSSLIAVACSHRLASMHVCCTVASACTAGAQTGLGFRYGCGRP